MTCRIVQGNLWDAKADVIGVTTNAFVTKHGRLVMGRGAAKEAALRFPALPAIAGTLLNEMGAAVRERRIVGNSQPYGWAVCTVPYPFKSEFTRIGLFQVKHHFADVARIALIIDSASKLVNWVDTHDKTVAINFPGIGYGHLPREQVEPILHEILNDPRITVYYQ